MADTVFTITINEDDVDSLAEALGYSTTIRDPDDINGIATLPNPESVEDYLTRWLIERWSDEWATYQYTAAAAPGYVGYNLGIAAS